MSVAELYNTTARTLSTVNEKMNFDINLNYGNVVTTQKEIIVKKAGLYKIDYGVRFDASQDAVIAIYFDENVYRPSELKLATGANNISSSFMIKVKLDSKISMRVASITGTLSTSADNRNAYLILTPVPQ